MSDVMLMRMTGVTGIPDQIYDFGNGAAWHISSMILALAIMYPVMKMRCKSTYLILIGMLLLGVLKLSTGTLLPFYYSEVSYTYCGNIWALGAIALGASIIPVTQQIKTWVQNKPLMKGVVSILLLAAIVSCINIHGSEETTPIIYDALAIGLIYTLISLSSVSITSMRSNSFWCNICTFFGKLSLLFYLMHASCTLIVINTRINLIGLSASQTIALQLILTLVASIVLMSVSNALRKLIYKLLENRRNTISS